MEKQEIDKLRDMEREELTFMYEEKEEEKWRTFKEWYPKVKKLMKKVNTNGR